MSRHTAPANRTLPGKAWAAISEDDPPQIYEVEWHKKHLRDDLRHIRVMVVPMVRKRKTIKRR